MEVEGVFMKKNIQKIVNMMSPVKWMLVVILMVSIWVISGLGLHKKDDTILEDKVVSVSTETIRASEHFLSRKFSGVTKAKKSIQLRPEVDGVVSAVIARDGAFLKAGEIILELDEEERRKLKDQADADLRSALMQYKAAKALQEKDLGSKNQVTQAEAQVKKAQAALEKAMSDLGKTKVRAAFDGYIENIKVKEGDYASTMLQTVFGTFSQLDQLLVMINLQKEDIELVSRAETIKVSNGISDASGTVNFAAKVADPGTRTFNLEIVIENPESKFRIGEFVNVEILSKVAEDVHYIPKSAITLSTDGRISAKSVDATNTVHSHYIEIVDEDLNGFWVKGMQGDVDVITVGASIVDDGHEVKR